ncbi:MAG: ABC transporter substrate-binding protein [archaeon]
MGVFGKDSLVIGGLVILVILIILGAVLFFAPPSIAFFSATQDSKLVVGASLALTGKAASYGVDIQNGINLALETITERGDKLNIQVLYDDTASIPQTAVTSAQKFLQVDGANVIIATGADEVLAIVPVTEEQKAILFTPIGGSDKIDGSGKYVFRNREPSKLTAYTLAEFLFKKHLSKVLLLVGKSSASPASYAQSFTEKFSSLGGLSENYYYDEASPDVRIALTKAKDNNTGAIYVVAGKDKDGADVVRQIKEMGFSGLVVGGPALDTTKFFESAREASEGVIIAVAPVDTSAPNAKNVLAEYKSKYGGDMPFAAANAYDMIMLLNSAAGKCVENTDCIREYLLSVKDYPGLGGKTTFNSSGGVTKPLALKVAKDGKFVLYKLG